MTIYPDEQKARVIERMLPPHNIDVPALSRETGIPKDTLYTWRLQARRARGLVTETPVTSAKRWSAAEKFAMVVETAALSETERGEYCRKRGVYGEQLEAWRRVCEQATGEERSEPVRSRSEAQADKRRIQQLERELRRKDKALAETAALLVLRKKAEAIWGKDEAE